MQGQPLKLLSFLVIMLATLAFQCELEEPPVPLTPCEALGATATDDQYYILDIRDGAIDSSFFSQTPQQGEDNRLTPVIQKALANLLDTTGTPPVINDQVVNTCMCQMILMEVDPLIDASDRVATVRSRIDHQDNGGNPNPIFKNVDYNYNFRIGPIEKLQFQRYDDKKEPPKSTSTDQIIIANIDSGMDYYHKWLQQNIWFNRWELAGTNGQDDDNNCLEDDIIGYDFLGKTSQSMDQLGHGTHVAGIIANGFHNATPTKIDFYNFSKSVSIMSLKVLDRDTASLFSAICAMRYALANKAQIINASWGYYADDASILLEEVVQQARDKEVFIVAAAGNDSINIDKCHHWPASFSRKYENVFTVASVRGNTISDFSNYGSQSVDFAAVGENIVSSFIYNNATTPLSGTSMSAPIATHIIARLTFDGKNYTDIVNELNNLAPANITNFSSKPLKQDAILKLTPP